MFDYWSNVNLTWMLHWRGNELQKHSTSPKQSDFQRIYDLFSLVLFCSRVKTCEGRWNLMRCDSYRWYVFSALLVFLWEIDRTCLDVEVEDLLPEVADAFRFIDRSNQPIMRPNVSLSWIGIAISWSEKSMGCIIGMKMLVTETVSLSSSVVVLTSDWCSNQSSDPNRWRASSGIPRGYDDRLPVISDP